MKIKNKPKVWSEIDDKHKRGFLRYAKNWEWKKILSLNYHEALVSNEDCKELYQWFIDMEQVAFEEQEEEMEWDENRWYDKERSLYILVLPSKKKPFALPSDMWKSIKEAYSNWDGSPASINEISRRNSLSRRTVIEILRVMGTTHDSSPWTEEELDNTSEDLLVEDLLRRKEEHVLVRAQKIEWQRIKKDAHKFRRIDLLTSHVEEKLSKKQPKQFKLPTNIKSNTKTGPHIVVVSPTDFHWGKYGPAYTGDAYNRTEAKERLFASTRALLERCFKKGNPEKIIIALGGDGLHIDNMQKTTTAGTSQSCDGTPEELVWSWVELCVDYVCMVREFANVCLFVVPGNHDYYTSVIMRSALYVFFRSDKNVDVVKGLSSRQYLTYGNNLLCFLHGDIGSVKDWPAIIAGENPKEWGASENRFIFTGHLHTERELPTFGGVTVYRMPSLAGTDPWHHKKGYKSRKALIAYVVDKEQGVITHEICPIREKNGTFQRDDRKHIK